MVAHFGGLDVVPLLGAMVECHCWVPGRGCILWRTGLGAIAGCHCSVPGVVAHFGGLGVVPLLGAMVERHGGVPLLGARGWLHTLPLLNLWRTGPGAIAGCHTSVPGGGRGAIAGCHC